MAVLELEKVDLAAVVLAMREHFQAALTGPIVGRTHMRDFVVEHLTCSALEAEELVDTLVARNLVRLDRADADGRGVWKLTER